MLANGGEGIAVDVKPLEEVPAAVEGTEAVAEEPEVVLEAEEPTATITEASD